MENPDRAEAIRMAVAEMEPGDALLIAGKGHEDYQIIGTTKRHFSDREAALTAIEEVYS
jgi:UDP-N-acetylmuramoyl-L-alanyl-D-glutamate--2,6-diaminopimelate ligase